jgi:O-antigen/teichoic acid export membrane protein
MFTYVNMGFNILFGFVLVPYYLTHIPQDIYGAWLASGSIAYWIVVINPGLTEIVQQQVAFNKGKQDRQELVRVVFSSIVVSILLCMVLFVLGSILSRFILDLLNLDSFYLVVQRAFYVIVLTICGTILSQTFIGFLNGFQLSFYVGLFNVISYLASILATFVLLERGYGLMGIAYASLVRVGLLLALSSSFLCFLSYGYVMKSLRLIFNTFQFQHHSILLKVFSYSFVSRIFSVISGNAESFLLARYYGVDIVTPIMITKKIPDLLVSFITRPTYAMTPSIALMKGIGNLEQLRPLIWRSFKIIIWLSGIGLSVLSIFNDDIIPLWLGKDLFAGHSINLAICFSAAMSIIFHVLSEVNISLGDIRSNAKIAIVQGVLYIPTVAVCIYFLGPVGIILSIGINRLMVSNWFLMNRLVVSLKCVTEDLLLLGKEVVCVLIIMIAVLFIFGKMEISSIPSLLALFCVHGVLYFCLLGILSDNFRKFLRVYFSRIAVLKS